MQETRGAVGGPQPSTAGTADLAPQAKPGLVAFVGTGPGDASLLTLRGAELLGQADLIIGGPELTRRLAHLLPDGATIIDPAEAPGDAGVLITAARAGQLAVRLCPGDPLLFGQAAGDAEACAKAAVRWEIVPGVPAATAVPAYAGMPLTSDAVGDVRIVHAADVSRVSTDGTPSEPAILGVCRRSSGQDADGRGWGDTTPMAITWNGTITDQHTVLTKLSSVQADLGQPGSARRPKWPGRCGLASAFARGCRGSRAAALLQGPGPADQGKPPRCPTGPLTVRCSGLVPTTRSSRHAPPADGTRHQRPGHGPVLGIAFTPGERGERCASRE
jgi:siroheme synthase